VAAPLPPNLFESHVLRLKNLIKQRRSPEDFPLMQFFYRKDWIESKQESAEFLSEQREGKWMLFIEDYNGDIADKSTRQEIRHSYKKAFDFLRKHNEAAAIWTACSPGAEAYVLVEIIETYPYLAHSAGFWKVKALASKLYGDYATTWHLVDPARARKKGKTGNTIKDEKKEDLVPPMLVGTADFVDDLGVIDIGAPCHASARGPCVLNSSCCCSWTGSDYKQCSAQY
jgi:hypothetical protein